MSGTVYTKDVLALSDYLFDLFPTLSGLEILAIAAETVDFYSNRGGVLPPADPFYRRDKDGNLLTNVWVRVDEKEGQS
jgi:hypothetical protein